MNAESTTLEATKAHEPDGVREEKGERRTGPGRGRRRARGVSREKILKAQHLVSFSLELIRARSGSLLAGPAARTLRRRVRTTSCENRDRARVMPGPGSSESWRRTRRSRGRRPLRRGGEDLGASSATGGGREPSESASSRDAASGSPRERPRRRETGGCLRRRRAGRCSLAARGGAREGAEELEISLHDIRAFQKAGDKEEAEAIAKERASWSDERRAEVEAEERAARKRFEDAHFATREDNPEGFLIDDGEGGRIRVPVDEGRHGEVDAGDAVGAHTGTVPNPRTGTSQNLAMTTPRVNENRRGFASRRESGWSVQRREAERMYARSTRVVPRAPRG